MPLIYSGTKHQPDVRNFLELTDPAARRGWKFSRFKPVVGEIDPCGSLADCLFVLCDVVGRNIVLSWIMFIGSNAAPIEAVIKLSRWRHGDVRGFSMNVRDTDKSKQQST